MITFTILLTVLLTVAIILGIIAVVLGTGFIAIFGDLLVCVAIMWLLVKLFKRLKK